MKNQKLSTKEKMVQVGMTLLQRHGYHGFSFQDIADELKLKKPSLYEHFGSKEELISAIIREYTNQFISWTNKVRELSPLKQIAGVFSIFQLFYNDGNKVCPILALAADSKSLSSGVQKEMEEFVEKWLYWLELQLLAGQADRSIRSDFPAKKLASLIYSQGMGSQFQSRIRGSEKQIKESSAFMIDFIKNR